jgi:hypothetical protein
MNRAVRYILHKAYPGIDLDNFKVIEVMPNYMFYQVASDLAHPRKNTETINLEKYALRGIRRTWTIYAGIGKSAIVYHSFKSTVEFVDIDSRWAVLER